ncbi:protein-tyrosine phosphatase-like protein [Trichoderma austrokoningii]
MGKREKGSSTSLVFPPSIFIGPVSAASSISLLQANSISHVLSVGISPSSKVPGVAYYRVSVSDSPTSSIMKISGATCHIIEAALQSNNSTGRVLVHCSAGISRSPAVVAAYLMEHHGMSLMSALGQIVRARPQASPNPGFLRELKELEVQLRGISSLEAEELPKREIDRLAMFPEEYQERQEQQLVG